MHLSSSAEKWIKIDGEWVLVTVAIQKPTTSAAPVIVDLVMAAIRPILDDLAYKH